MSWSKYTLCLLWCGWLAAAGIVLWPHRHAWPLETNVLSLLPAAEQDPVAEQASRALNESLSRQQLVLVGASSATETIAIAGPLAQALTDSGVFAAVSARLDTAQGQALARFYRPYRNGLLAGDTLAALQHGQRQAVVQRALQALYSPGSAVNSAWLGNDPLLVFSDFLTSLNTAPAGLRIEQGHAFFMHAGHYYLPIVLELADSPFSLDQQRRALPALDAALAAARTAHPATDIVDTGVLRYAAAGVNGARHEVSTIGTGSLAGIVLLFAWVFRSARPLLITLLPMACGFVTAFAACVLLFGRVHLMTLVFGASLIGLSVDYSLHFFIDRQASDACWQPADTLRRITAGLTAGLITSVTGFAALCLAPFPAMQQMAVFCATGLITAWLTVLAIFPLLVRHGDPRPAPGLGWARHWLALWSHPRWLAVALLATLVFAVTGIARLAPNDDIRLLQDKPPTLVADEQRVRTITGQAAGGQFLLVEGDSAESLLVRNETLLARLEQAQADGWLDGFDSISRWLPSLARQQAQAAALAGLADSPEAAAYASHLGLDPALLGIYRQAPAQLTPQAWLADAVSLPWRKLWLGDTGRGYATMVPLRGVHDAAALQALAQQLPGVRWVDPVTDISSLLAAYRERASRLAIAAYGVIALGLWLRYRRRAWRALAPPVLAAATALATVGWLGESLTLFHLLALLLVLGFGIDYSLFLLEGREHPAPTMLAIGLSAATTLLSFGLLALSNTPAIHAFGIVVLTGIAVALLFAPLARPVSPRGYS